MSSQLIPCPSCGANNRVPQDKIDQGRVPVCGRCKTPLSISAKPVTVTDSTFAELVERSPVPVILDLWAPWCGPCRMIAPILDDLSVELAGRVRVAKINVDENPATSSRFGIRSIPALLIFQSGREVDRLIGAQPKSEIVRRLEPIMAAANSR